MARWKNIIIVIIVIIATAIVMALSVKPKSQVMKYMSKAGYIIKPIQSGLSTIQNGVKNTVGFLPNAGKVESQNKKLQKQVDILQNKILKYEEYKKENTRLLSLLKLKSLYSYKKSVAAQIIAKDPTNWFDTFLINKGSNQGIKNNMPVITYKGLVGYVIQAGPNWSKVISILDSDCSASSLVVRTRDSGICVGDESINPNGLIKMNYINNSSKVSIGDSVETSGMGETFPKGIPIGKVSLIKRDSDQLTKFAIIKPYVNFYKIEDVMVIIKK